jgi:hypothetical protein
MIWNTTELIERFQRPENWTVVEYLVRVHPSAHTDVVLEMELSVEELQGVRMFCPDGPNCSYSFMHTSENIIFSISIGMQLLAYRLSEADRIAAVATGGAPVPELGPEWVRFYPFDPDMPVKEMRANLKRWCVAAYNLAISF